MWKFESGEINDTKNANNNLLQKYLSFFIKFNITFNDQIL